MGKVKWGIIGAGGIANRRFIPALLKSANSELIAIMNPSRHCEIAKKYNVPKGTDNIQELLSNPDIDAVYIASPVSYHYDQIKLAAEAGKHILCEKPLTISSNQARDAVAICHNCGVKLQEGYMMKFHGAHQKIKEIISSGILGKIVYIRTQLSCWYPPISGAWRQDPAKGGGGVLIDMATHLFDLLGFFVGKIAKVGSIVASLVHDYTPEDSSVTLVQFESGTIASVDCFFNIPDEASGSRLEVYGSKGSVIAQGTIGQNSEGNLEGSFVSRNAHYNALQNKKYDFQNIPFEKVDMYKAEAEYFSSCILNGLPVQVNDGNNAIHILEIVEKAYESSKTGRFLGL